MALTNFVTSIVIARNFDEKYFATYLSVAALLAIISIPMQSIQTAYAIHPDKQEIRISLPKIHRSGTSVRSIIALLAMIWFCSLPILLKFSGIELNTLLASSALFLVLLPSNIVSGKLRNLERFSSWRVLLAGTALIQIPIAVFTATLNLDLWLYLLLLCAPSLVYVSLALFVFDIPTTSNRHSVFVGWSSVCYSLVSSYSLQLPLIFSVKLIVGASLGSILIFYFFSIAISLGSVFGTFFVPSFVRGDFSPRVFSRVNLIFCVPSIALGLLLMSPLKNLIPVLFGQKYAISFSGIFAILLIFSSMVWSMFASHSQIKLGDISWKILSSGSAVLFFEWMYLMFFVDSIEEIVLAHSLTSIIQLSILNFGKFSRSTKSTD
jgi:hypothetical protein